MDKFPVWWNGTSVGELTVEKESLHTYFSVSAVLPKEGFWAAWLIGDGGEFRLGILEPEDCVGKIQRRFSDRMIRSLGTFLRGELRPVNLKQNFWEPVSNPTRLFRTFQLPKEITEGGNLLTKQENGGRWIAVLYDKEKSFPLVELFCFAKFLEIESRNYLAFFFDRQERIVFGEIQGFSDRQRLEKILKT
jgi:hypothetical protein